MCGINDCLLESWVHFSVKQSATPGPEFTGLQNDFILWYTRHFVKEVFDASTKGFVSILASSQFHWFFTCYGFIWKPWIFIFMYGEWIGGAVFMLECENFSEPPIKLSERVEDYNLAQNPCAIWSLILGNLHQVMMYFKLVDAKLYRIRIFNCLTFYSEIILLTVWAVEF